MGLYDRDYIRDVEPRRGAYGRGGWSSLRMVSVNAWIIAICVGVFVIDNLLIPKAAWQLVRISTDLPASIELQLGRNAKFQEDPRLIAGPRQGTYTGVVLDVSVSPATAVGTATYVWMPPLKRWLHLSTSLVILRIEFWRFIGFQFLHGDQWHLLFNMLGLYFFGGMVEQYLGSKRYLAFYLLCGVFGAVLYLVLNLLGLTAAMFTREGVTIPGLLSSSMFTPLVGASAGIFGVLMAGAFLAPRAVVLLFFIIPMQLRTLAYALVAVAFLSIVLGAHNAGGEAGHLGGAIAGWYFIRHPYHLHGFFDFLGRVDPTSHHYRGRQGRPRTLRGARSRARDDEVDRILAKIKDQGVQSLTEAEKRVLRDVSRQGT